MGYNLSMNFIIFVAAFLVVANRHVVQHLFERLSRPKAELRKSEDRNILDRVFRKTGVKLPHFWISDAQSFWGLMAGLPGSPQMFLSTYALDTFTPDELDWLMLHESGHYVLNHTLKEAVYQLALIATGVFVLWNFNNIYLALALGLLLGIMGVQLGKYHEQEAELFALRRVDSWRTASVAELICRCRNGRGAPRIRPRCR